MKQIQIITIDWLKKQTIFVIVIVFLLISYLVTAIATGVIYLFNLDDIIWVSLDYSNEYVILSFVSGVLFAPFIETILFQYLPSLCYLI